MLPDSLRLPLHCTLVPQTDKDLTPATFPRSFPHKELSRWCVQLRAAQLRHHQGPALDSTGEGQESPHGALSVSAVRWSLSFLLTYPPPPRSVGTDICPLLAWLGNEARKPSFCFDSSSGLPSSDLLNHPASQERQGSSLL